jgi:hypothetical protein
VARVEGAFVSVVTSASVAVLSDESVDALAGSSCVIANTSVEASTVANGGNVEDSERGSGGIDHEYVVIEIEICCSITHWKIVPSHNVHISLLIVVDGNVSSVQIGIPVSRIE